MQALLFSLVLGFGPAEGPGPRPSEADRVDDPRFTLEQALAAMDEGHPLLQAGGAEVDAARARVRSARLWTNPQFDLDYMWGVRATSYDPAGSWIGSIGQFIELSGAPQARGRVARHELGATRADLDDIRMSLAYDVEVAMIELRARVDEVAVLDQNIADFEHGLAIVRARVEAGVISTYDETRTLLALAQAKAALAQAKAAALDAREQLALAAGPLAARLQGQPDIELDVARPLPPLDGLRDAQVQRPDLVANRAIADAASAKVDLARREVMPGIGLRVLAGFGQGPGQVDFGFGVSVPLPVVQRGQAAIPEAQATARAAHARSSAAQIAAEQQLELAHQRAELLRDRSQAFAVTQPLAERLKAQAELAYTDGQIEIIGLMDAYLAVRDQGLREIVLALDAHLAEVQLRRLAGAR
ncbi:Heavy metal RND efflux outer membrane protein, CzcC family protein [Enhygromyxa salina]|uniref:Heavy metal RND efflux outer membrane protein, CzcC family protein n=2 Tax=Enhygromyxa salina TaxID=215803 RepID=A0A0C2CQR5_9BACT|nr:Heavy metal RND efflux outer membrane protein, CzcC family protein [Enhygromyxa salina]